MVKGAELRLAIRKYKDVLSRLSLLAGAGGAIITEEYEYADSTFLISERSKEKVPEP